MRIKYPETINHAADSIKLLAARRGAICLMVCDLADRHKTVMNRDNDPERKAQQYQQTRDK